MHFICILLIYPQLTGSFYILCCQRIAPKSLINSSLQLWQQAISGKYCNNYKSKHLPVNFILRNVNERYFLGRKKIDCFVDMELIEHYSRNISKQDSNSDFAIRIMLSFTFNFYYLWQNLSSKIKDYLGAEFDYLEIS